MRKGLRRTSALAIAVVALAVAAGVAFAGTQFGSKDDQQAVVNDAARRLGVSPSKLSDALREAVDARIDAAVAAGRLTKEQGERLKARAAEGPLPFGGERRGWGPPGGHDGFGFGRGERFGADVLGMAARYLGVSSEALRAELREGKTLGQVAKAHGKTADGLIDAVVVAARKRLDQAVADGRLTSQQAQDMASRFSQVARAIVNGGALPHPGGRECPDGPNGESRAPGQEQAPNSSFAPPSVAPLEANAPVAVA
jgi:hypothetical protein